MQRWQWGPVDEAAETLGAIGVCHGDTLLVMIRLRGGAGSPAKDPTRPQRVREPAKIYNAGNSPARTCPPPRERSAPIGAETARPRPPPLSASAPSSPKAAKRTAKTPARPLSAGSPISPSESLRELFRDSVSSDATSTLTARSLTASLAFSRSPSHAASDARPSTHHAAPHGPPRTTTTAAAVGERTPEGRGGAQNQSRDDDPAGPLHRERAASEAPSSAWDSEPEGDDDMELGLRNCFHLPVLPRWEDHRHHKLQAPGDAPARGWSAVHPGQLFPGPRDARQAVSDVPEGVAAAQARRRPRHVQEMLAGRATTHGRRDATPVARTSAFS